MTTSIARDTRES